MKRTLFRKVWRDLHLHAGAGLALDALGCLFKQRLLEELKNELLFANRNVNQLAEEFHFSDPSHLMRFFKRETEKTFTQYLRDYQNGIYE